MNTTRQHRLSLLVNGGPKLICLDTTLPTSILSYHNEYVVGINIYEFVIGFMGNIIACAVILSSRSIRTLTDFYLLSLSTADLVIITDLAAKWLVQAYPNDVALYTRQWIFQTSVNASVLTVTAFTVERYLAICHPFYVQSMAKTSRVKKMIITIWLTGTLLALLPVLHDFFFKRKLRCVPATSFQKAFEDSWPYALYFCTFVYFVLPMFLITVMYILIFIKLKKKLLDKRIASQAGRTDVRTMKMFIIIIVAFFISWAPYYAYYIINHYGRPRIATSMYVHARHYKEYNPKDMSYVPKNYYFQPTRWAFYDNQISPLLRFTSICSNVTYSLSSVLNPIIYVMMSQKFRKACKELFTTSRKKWIDWTTISRNAQTNDIHLESNLQMI